MEMKHWWASKTIWVNFVAIVGILLNSQFGIELDTEVQAALATSILAIINIVLRIMTTQPVGK